MSSTARYDNGNLGAAAASSTPEDDNLAFSCQEPSYAGASTSSASVEVGDLAELISLWPLELPAEQVAIWAGMTKAHKETAIRRLSAIVRYEAGGSRTAADFVEDAGVSLPRFHSILKAWRTDRSLLALVPQARRRAPRTFTPPPGIEAAARAAVRDDRNSSIESLSQAIHARFGQPSLSWTRRLVTRVRRDFERELVGGAAGFASRIVVDSTALPLPLAPSASGTSEIGDDGHPDQLVEWAVAAFAWDAATGRILGSAIETAPASMALHAAAALAAADWLRDIKAVRRPKVDPVVVTTIPLDSMETLRLMVDLASVGLEVVHSSRASGSELMKAFDGRLGQLDFRPRFAADGFVGRTSRAEALAQAGRSPMSLSEARLVVEHEVERHNAAIAPPDPGPAVAPAVVADRLERIFRRFADR